MTPEERAAQLHRSDCTCVLPDTSHHRPDMANCQKCLADMIREDCRIAILAERERCAKVAETFPIRAETCRAWDMQPAIADAIREEPRNE